MRKQPTKICNIKIGEHIPCEYSMSTIWGSDHINCMKKFCEPLKKHATRIIGFKKKKMLSLTNKELKAHKDAKIRYICRKYFIKKLSRVINYQKVRDHCHYTGNYRGPANSICNLKFNVPNEIPVVFYSGSDYNCHFIIK